MTNVIMFMFFFIFFKEDINYISSDLSTLEHRHYNTTFISTDRADQPAHISSDNLILSTSLDPEHGYGEQTYKWNTGTTWRILGRVKKGAEWGSWIEYNTNP